MAGPRAGFVWAWLSGGEAPGGGRGSALCRPRSRARVRSLRGSVGHSDEACRLAWAARKTH
eukprot:9474457-Pyramimonas_sp.AAC.1